MASVVPPQTNQLRSPSRPSPMLGCYAAFIDLPGLYHVSHPVSPLHLAACHVWVGFASFLDDRNG